MRQKRGFYDTRWLIGHKGMKSSKPAGEGKYNWLVRCTHGRAEDFQVRGLQNARSIECINKVLAKRVEESTVQGRVEGDRA